MRILLLPYRICLPCWPLSADVGRNKDTGFVTMNQLLERAQGTVSQYLHSSWLVLAAILDLVWLVGSRGPLADLDDTRKASGSGCAAYTPQGEFALPSTEQDKGELVWTITQPTAHLSLHSTTEIIQWLVKSSNRAHQDPGNISCR